MRDEKGETLGYKNIKCEGASEISRKTVQEVCVREKVERVTDEKVGNTG